MSLHNCTADIEANYKPIGDADPATAIAPGGAVPLRSPTAITFYRLTILASFFQTIAAPLNTSIFALYLHGAPPTVAQLTSLQAIAWSLRVACAMCSDTIKLGGYRRKLWLLMGWIITTTSVAVMAFSDFGPPYCDPNVNPGCMRTAPTNAKSQIYDLSAPSRVRWYRVPTFFSAVGMVMVQTTLDGAMVEIAHREPVDIRGQFQTVAVLVSGIGAVLTRVLLQFGFNEKRYGGNYDYSAGPHVAYGILFGLGLLGCVATALRFEDTLSPIEECFNWWRQLWSLLQTRAVYQLLSFRLLTSVFQSTSGPSVMNWVTNLDFVWTNVVQRVPFTPTLIVIFFKGMGWNWRKVVFITTLGSIVVTAIPVLCVTWNVCRNAYFYVLILWLSFVGN
ncbi:hypothetical protein SDRG_15879 [Saprolegnia diclina VS20]|uniref:Major facilitator superfamily associated domain-containing protein n=1 Tax=Saprolegnia diclina (strain VS20) TaxID=1156394 RepID=T0R9U6_SAPDV|nr:hypothetical protein SDRG_15879 [Saprolegnia diclina VS20]EQC26292.1 hypothetical protein SDRG_15879 [Saprolegnia diclina VS20]|eukprot:XP_008620287.1 hypothetical protein SDRG_15879 [Saprolegnia diclina VS20]